MTGAAQSLARRARRALLIRRAAEAGASAAAAGLAVGLVARLEGWASPGAAAAAAAIAALAAFWAAARSHFQFATELSPEADQDALLRSALSSSAGAEWRELLAGAAAQRKPAFEPAGEWIPALLLAAAAVFALAWHDSRPRYAPPLAPPAAAGNAAAESARAADPAAALRAGESQAVAQAGDGEGTAAQGEWRTLEPAAASGSILLPPGAAARERSAIERFLRLRAAAAE